MKRALLLLALVACTRETSRHASTQPASPVVVDVPTAQAQGPIPYDEPTVVVHGPAQLGDGNVQVNASADLVDAGGFAVWLGPNAAVPSSTNYSLLASSCHHIVQRSGTTVKDYDRCDPVFDGCFRGCGASLVQSYPTWGGPGDDALTARVTAEAIACADECDRRSPRDGGSVIINVP